MLKLIDSQNWGWAKWGLLKESSRSKHFTDLRKTVKRRKRRSVIEKLEQCEWTDRDIFIRVGDEIRIKNNKYFKSRW